MSREIKGFWGGQSKPIHELERNFKRELAGKRKQAKTIAGRISVT